MNRVILHLDLDAFYASVEEREDKSLEGKAVVVCMFSARGRDSGAVATPNYKARESGIRSGMAIKQAKKLNPDAIYLPARRDLYTTVSENVMGVLKENADAFEQVSVDEAFLDVSEMCGGDFKAASSIAKRIKGIIKKQERLTSSVGIGPNKLISKMAASIVKPDGLTLVMPEDVEGFLNPLDVSKLWGVGVKTKKALGEIGVKRIGELKGVEINRLIELFGKAKGRWLYNASRGVDDEPVVERGDRDQIGRISTLKEDTRDFEELKGKIDELGREIHERVIERGVLFKTITFNAVTQDLKGHSKSRTLSAPTNDLRAVLETGGQLIGDFLSENEGQIRRAGIRVSNLSAPSGQKTLLQF
jgi:DNA polymerase IV (DinB-like DNA polymerase)